MNDEPARERFRTVHRSSFIVHRCETMLYRFEDIEKSYGPHDVLRGVTWQHNPGEKIGLVGRNGAGKTTLFKLLLKEEEPDRGQIIRASGLTIGHVSQHLDAEPSMTLFDYVETAFAEVLDIERKMRAIEHDLSDPSTNHERLLEKYAALQHDYEHANGYTLHSERSEERRVGKARRS